MSKLPRDISGEQVARHLVRKWAYRRSDQTGSHIILDTDTPSPHRLSIPAHSFIKVGLLSAILQDVATHKGVTREDILRDL